MDPRTIAEIEVPALAQVRGTWFYLLATHGELILDYAAYDPAYNPSAWEHPFRGNLLTVLPADGFHFLSALQESVFPVAAIPGFVQLNAQRSRPVAAIDFDTARFVSSFYDQALETLCGDAWNADLADPLAIVPETVSALFEARI